ncbi:MAG TPA: xylulokinase [Streptosporangiaceae bacterium]|jgi:xylulokinase
MAVVAGIDSSTQSAKVLLVDTDDGAVIGVGRAAHQVTGTGGARESDPAQWWTALAEALAAAVRDAGVRTIAALSVGGQQHGLVVLDAEGVPLRRALLWNDTRSAPQAEELTAALGGAAAWAERTGTVPVASITVTKWAALRAHEPSVAAATRGVRLPHDYLTGRLMGAGASGGGGASGMGVTDRGDASGTGWYSTVREDYDPDILGLPGVRLDPELLPRVVPAGKPAGTVAEPAVRDVPAAAGALVAAGTGDNMAAALGLGFDATAAARSPALSLGTSGTVYTASPSRTTDPHGIVAGFCDAVDGYLPLACTLNCTEAIDRVAGWLGRDREAVEPGGEVVMLPFLDGERTPNLPTATGTLTGLRHTTTAGQILRAAYEGAVFTLLTGLDAINGATGEPASEEPIVLVGGGARGTAWRDTVARLSGRPLVIPRNTELVALGAAAQAAGLLTGERPAAIAHRWNTTEGHMIEAVARDDAARERLGAALGGASGR